MQNLIRFFIKYRAFFFFILLEAFCLYQIVNAKSYHKATYFNASNSVSSSIRGFFYSLGQYFDLKKTNDELAEENADLRKYLEALMSKSDLVKEVLEDSVLLNKFDLIPAKVINNPVNLIDNHFTMNKGSVDGVRPQMGVITNQGLVGVVQSTSENFSVAKSLMNTKLEVSAKLKGHNQFGYVKWDGNSINETHLLNISNHIKVEIGDTVTSTASSFSFPENTCIGFVKNIKSVEGKAFYDIELSLANDMQQLHYVYLIENKFKKEQKDLEEKVSNGQ